MFAWSGNAAPTATVEHTTVAVCLRMMAED